MQWGHLTGPIAGIELARIALILFVLNSVRLLFERLL